MVVYEEYNSKLTIMSTVLPGDQIPARHVNLKLGPGLLQISTVATNKTTESTVIATRAGTLNHSTNGSKWWIETNSRRVRKSYFSKHKEILIFFRVYLVYPCTTRIGDRSHYPKSG